MDFSLPKKDPPYNAIWIDEKKLPRKLQNEQAAEEISCPSFSFTFLPLEEGAFLRTNRMSTRRVEKPQEN